jgi:hypothetical protein
MLVSFLGRTVERTIYLGLGLLITTIMLVSIWHYMSLSMIDVSPHCVGRLKKNHWLVQIGFSTRLRYRGYIRIC